MVRETRRKLTNTPSTEFHSFCPCWVLRGWCRRDEKETSTQLLWSFLWNQKCFLFCSNCAFGCRGPERDFTARKLTDKLRKQGFGHGLCFYDRKSLCKAVRAATDLGTIKTCRSSSRSPEPRGTDTHPSTTCTTLHCTLQQEAWGVHSSCILV